MLAESSRQSQVFQRVSVLVTGPSQSSAPQPGVADGAAHLVGLRDIRAMRRDERQRSSRIASRAVRHGV